MVRAGIENARTNVARPTASSAAATSVRPLITRNDAAPKRRNAPRISRIARLSQRLRAALGASVNQPPATTCCSSAALNTSSLSPKPRSALGSR